MIVAGASKIGKSFLVLELCRALSLADNPFGCPDLYVPESARVLLIEDEVKEAGLQERGLKVFAGADYGLLNNNFFVLSGVPEIRFDSNMGWKLLDDAIAQVQPNVLVLDPFGRFIGGLDENRNDEMGKVLGKLDQILKNYQHNEMSLILTHHSKKPDTSAESKYDPLSPHSMRGASRMFANPDTIVMVQRLEDIKSAAGHKAWKVRMHFETRQSEGPDDVVLTVNRDDDLRVRFSHKLGGAPKLKQEPKPKVPPEQLKLAEAEPAKSAAPWFAEGAQRPR